MSSDCVLLSYKWILINTNMIRTASRENLAVLGANNTLAYQPAHLRSLVKCLCCSISGVYYSYSHNFNILTALCTVLTAKSDSGVIFCYQSYHGLFIDRLCVLCSPIRLMHK